METFVYSKEGCPYCVKAKDLLDFYGFPYTEMKLDVDFTREELFKKFPHAKTFPQIIFEGEYVGGYDQLAKKLG